MTFYSKSLAAANGQWVDGPQALLEGSASIGNMSNVILELNAYASIPMAPSVRTATQTVFVAELQ
jgi:hypothetical protein